MKFYDVKQCADIVDLSLGGVYKHIRARTDWGQLFGLRQGVYVISEDDLKKFPGRRKRESKRGVTTEKKISFRVSEAELETIAWLADGAQMSVAEWCRHRALGTREKDS